MGATDRLVFVYNADSGLVNAVRDVWHRMTSPSTYPCQLCKVTYGVTGMRSDWRHFTDGLDVPVEFLHRDEFRAAHATTLPTEVELPAAWLDRDGELVEVVSADRLRGATTVRELEQLVSDGLAAQDG